MLCKTLYLFLLIAFMFGSSWSKTGDVCSQPLIEPGLCKGSFTRYGFDGTKCRKFIWGGCPNNGNNFEHLAQCQAACETKYTIGPVPY